MEYTKILFYVFASWAILASLLTVFARNAAKAALFLVWAFFSFASLWILVEAEFLATILILVYVGAVMVLFLFVVKMLNIDKSTLRAKFAGYLPLGIIISLLVIAEMYLAFSGVEMTAPVKPDYYSNITELAMSLYTKYVLQFELAAVILLIAIISAISLVHRPSTNRKMQNVASQVAVNPKDRLKIVKMEKGVKK
jgi:NADH-quinone oxidoreductase subunit J